MAAAAPSLVCDALPAVTLPCAWKAGFSLASASSEVSRRGPSSVANRRVAGAGARAPTVGGASSAAMSSGTISVVESARVDGGHRSPMALEGEAVLRLARDARFPCVVLSHETGREIDVGIGVHERRVRRQLVAAHRHQAHRLGAAGDDDLGGADHDALGGLGNRLQAGRTEAVDRHRRGGVRHAGAQAGDARDVQPLLGLRHRAPEDDIVHLRRIERGDARERARDRRGGHVVGTRGAERAVRRLADRGADCGHDDGLFHGLHTPLNAPGPPAHPRLRSHARRTRGRRRRSRPVRAAPRACRKNAGPA